VAAKIRQRSELADNPIGIRIPRVWVSPAAALARQASVQLKDEDGYSQAMR
jgi:hypothetical protein